MRLVRLGISRFRGIRTLEWSADQPVACLVGAGDSGKTTVLEAIEWALWPRWNLAVSDADFYGLGVGDPIVIEATVADVPSALRTTRTFDINTQWRGTDGVIRDEPLDGDEPVLTVRLTVDANLEPQWEVICGERQPPRRIGYQQRAALGVTRLDGRPDRHLRWGRGSALERLTESTAEATQVLADAYRMARGAVTAEQLQGLDEAIAAARKAVPAYGSGLDVDRLGPAIDPAALSPTAAALALHVAGLPLTSSGLGTRSLAALALQIASIPEGAILLIDEVESGLEPYRLRHLLRHLRRAVAGEDPGGESAPGQVIMTTHSPITVVELPAAALQVVRTDPNGWVGLRTPPDDLQGVIRGQPEAMLAPSVIVGEGGTEYGLVRGLDVAWSSDGDAVPLAHQGVGLADGGGRTKAPGIAIHLSRLGYRVALLVDSDEPINPDVSVLESAGVHVTQWGDGSCTEHRIATDLPLDGLLGILKYVAEIRGDGQVRGDIGARLDRSGDELPEHLEDWPEEVGEPRFRAAVGVAMNKGNWIKRIDFAEDVGRMIAPRLREVAGTDLAQKLAGLRNWVAGA